MLVCPRCRTVYVAGEKCGLDGARLERTGRDPLVGQTVGKYQIESLLAEGRTGRVYRALDAGRPLAMKVLYGDISKDKKLAARWVQQARAAGKLDASCVWPVIDGALTDGGLAIVVRELAAGGSLADSLKQSGARTPRSAARIIRQIAVALSRLHAAGVVFEDLRPQAVLLDGPPGKERARLTEAGQVSLLRSASPPITSLMPDGRYFQYAAYLSPEQVKGEAATARSDVYALGVMLYELLIGFPPFTEAAGHTRDRVPAPKLAYMGLADLALRLLEKEVGRRPQTAAAVVTELDRLGLVDSDLPRAASQSPADEVRLSIPPRAMTPLPSSPPTALPAPLHARRMGAGTWVAMGLLAGTAALTALRWDDVKQMMSAEPPVPVAREAAAPPPAEVPAEVQVAARAAEAATDAKPAPLPELELTPPRHEPKPPPLVAPKPEPKLAAKAGDADAGLSEFQQLDFELGRALSGAGLVWDDLAQAAFAPAKQWGRWYRNQEAPSSEQLNATYKELIEAVDLAAKMKRARHPAAVTASISSNG